MNSNQHLLWLMSLLQLFYFHPNLCYHSTKKAETDVLSVFFLQLRSHDRQCCFDCYWHFAWERCSRITRKMSSTRHVWQVSKFYVVFNMLTVCSYIFNFSLLSVGPLQYCYSGCCSEYAGALQVGSCWHSSSSVLLWVHYIRGKPSFQFSPFIFF